MALNASSRAFFSSTSLSFSISERYFDFTALNISSLIFAPT